LIYTVLSIFTHPYIQTICYPHTVYLSWRFDI